MRKPQITLVAILILVLLVLVGGYSYFKSPHKTKGAASTQPIPVIVATAQQASIRQQVQAVGSLQATQKVSVNAEIDGQIRAIYFKDGAFVKQGQALVQLDDDIFKSELASDQADLKIKKADYMRKKSLMGGSVPRSKLEQAYAAYQQAAAKVQESQTKLGKMRLVAPFSGMLAARQLDVGQFVQSGGAIVTLIATNPLRVQYTLPASYFNQLRLKQDILIQPNDLPQQHFTGAVSYIAPMIDAQTRTITLRAIVPNPKHVLQAGMFVRVTQYLGKLPNVVLIPERALIPNINGYQVMTVVKQRVVVKSVKIGIHHGRLVQITHGLQPGAVVIVDGVERVHAGDVVSTKTL